MIEREKIIKTYFESWLNNNALILEDIFDSKIIYSECYGPEYHGIEIIKRWFGDWNKQGQVLIWDIKQFIHEANISVVEWHFKCEYNREIGEFDGISLIEFNNVNKIISIKEFQSKTPHYFLYK